MRLSDKLLELVSVLNEANSNNIFIFLLNRAGSKFKPYAHVQKELISFDRPSKNISSGDPSL